MTVVKFHSERGYCRVQIFLLTFTFFSRFHFRYHNENTDQKKKRKKKEEKNKPKQKNFFRRFFLNGTPSTEKKQLSEI